MPDNEINIKDVFTRIISLEEKVNLLLAELQRLKPLDNHDIIEVSEKGAGAFINPDTGLFDMKYFKSMHPKDEGMK